MPFIIKAQTNESIVLTTYGIPISIFQSWSLIPFPCCQVAKRFNLGRYNLQFECAEIFTKDDIGVSLILSVKFIVDRSSKAKIMKAYRDFFGYEMHTEVDVFDIQSKVLEIIYQIVTKHVRKMTFSEIVKFNWLFVDSIFTEIKFVLKDSSVILQELTMDEIHQYTDIVKNDICDKVIDKDTNTDYDKVGQDITGIDDDGIKDNVQDHELEPKPSIFVCNEASEEDVVDQSEFGKDREIGYISNQTIHLKRVKQFKEDILLDENKCKQTIQTDSGEIIETERGEFDTISIISIEEKPFKKQVSVLYNDHVPTNFVVRGISQRNNNIVTDTNPDSFNDYGNFVFDECDLNLPKPRVTEEGLLLDDHSPTKRLLVKQKADDGMESGKLRNVLNKDEAPPLQSKSMHEENSESGIFEMYESRMEDNSVNTGKGDFGSNDSVTRENNKPYAGCSSSMSNEAECPEYSDVTTEKNPDAGSTVPLYGTSEFNLLLSR